MNITIIQHNINGEQVNAVSSIQLHKALQVETNQSKWIKSQIKMLNDERTNFIEGVDYVILAPGGKNVGRPQTEYLLSLNMAKQIAMKSGGQIGNDIRQYFIDFEEKVTHQVKQTGVYVPAGLKNADVDVLEFLGEKIQELVATKKEAARLEEKVEQVTEQRDYHIHSKGAVVRINNEMNLQIGAAHNYAAVGKVMKAVPHNHKLKKIHPSRIGKTLVQFSNILGHQVIKVSLNALTEVNAYHKDVWMNAYNISIEELFPRTLKKKILKASETGENDLINF